MTRAATRSVIPPLSAVSRRSFGHDLRAPPHPQDFDEEDDAKSDYYDDDEGEEEVSDGEEEEVVEEEEDMDGQVSRPKSSATTRDSGISVFSGANDGEAPAENGKVGGKESRGPATVGRRARGQYTPKGPLSTSSPRLSSSSSTLSSGDERGRSSYDGVPVGGRRKGDVTSPSRRSLPNDALLGVMGKGIPGGRSRITPPKDKEFRNFDYESDFETDEEDIKLANTTLTKMKLLRKKQDGMKEIERRRLDRDTRRAQEERVRKYRQLELQHSQNSLQPSSAESGDSKLAVQSNLSYKGRDSHLRRSPRRSLRHSPSPSPTPLARIPTSKSYNANLSRKFSKAPEKRHRSLERNVNRQVNGVNPRETFSRTPQLVKRGQPPMSFGGGGGEGDGGGGGRQLSSNYGTTTANKRYGKQTPDRTPDYPTPPMTSSGLRIAKPASSCFKRHLEPFASPPDALRNAIERLSSNDWESQVEGIEMLVRLCQHHPDMLLGSLRSINMSLMKQAKNLRSQVSRAAIQAFTCFYDKLKRNMEGDSEKITAILLNRTVDTNKFLQLDSHHALDAMVENITPSKAIPAIIQEGLNHRNPAVRTTVARLLAYQVERLGPSRVLSGQKDITDRILVATAKLAQEGSLETRQHAKQVFQQLIRQGQFDAVLKKHVSPNDIKNIQKILDNLSNEGRPVHESARFKFASGSRYTRTM
ncbi:TOG array regulator of axonemal microtubules protein 2-like [Eriocheir sinensis]|uniref:TOG array regulator of axonemal microtubules protein 2-like n=1 Tax=Eriocheir sinensis TaxID=95602 RepID=UPI0021C6A7D7|nr:TOG array regulator of axonemal microtubules protein 2-like [Eriocheir sinensis]